jgi:hypothetical protein
VPRVEWRPGPDFAEVAEALGIPTDQVMTIKIEPDGAITAFYQKDPNKTLLWSQVLRRDADDVLIRFGLSHPHPGMWEGIEAEARRRHG